MYVIGAGLCVIGNVVVDDDKGAAAGEGSHCAHDADGYEAFGSDVDKGHGAAGNAVEDLAVLIGLNSQDVGIGLDLDGQTVALILAVNANDDLNGIAGGGGNAVGAEGHNVTGRCEGGDRGEGENHCDCNDCCEKLFHFYFLRFLIYRPCRYTLNLRWIRRRKRA